MIREVFLVPRVSCIYRGDFKEGVSPDRCEHCSFLNEYIKDKDGNVTGVDCLRDEIGQIRGHVTRFEKGDYEYSSRMYDEEKDGPLTEAYNYCEKCCFSKTLSNGRGVCLLRCGTSGSDEWSNFMCYEGEIWEEKKIES